jgi:predicted amidohydrolase
LTGIVAAASQIGVSLGDIPGNVARCIASLEAAANEGVDLVVFPECALSGYIFEDRLQGEKAAVRLDGSELAAIGAACKRLSIHCVVGFLETASPGRLFNAAVLLGPEGIAGHYRKAHLPFIGVDRFVDQGDLPDPAVFDTPMGRIGILICYDLRFPESARVLALAGAQLIAMPTNWPLQSTILADHFTKVRACENRVFIVAADRGDDEGSVSFLGRSQIVAPSGAVLADVGRGEALLTARVDLAEASEKHVIFAPGTFELDLFVDRRPDLYGIIQERPRGAR